MTDPDKRICASTAKSVYELTENDLEALNCLYVRNPYYRCAGDMRLYLQSEVEELAAEVKKQRQYMIDHADEIKAEKLQAAKDKKKNQDISAKEIINAFKTVDISFTNSLLPLPLDVIDIVMQNVALDEQTDEFLRSPTNIAKTLISIERSCKELRGSTQNAWKLIQPNNPLPDTVDWDAILSNPLNHKVEDLKQALKAIKQPLSGTKAVLVIRLLDWFGLEQPAHASANAIIAVREENSIGSFAKYKYNNKTPYASKFITNKYDISLKDYREWFIARFGDMNGYNAFVRDEIDKQKKLEEAEHIAKLERIAKMNEKVIKISSTICIICKKSSRAQKCKNNCCGKCCGKFENAIDCTRHHIIF